MEDGFASVVAETGQVLAVFRELLNAAAFADDPDGVSPLNVYPVNPCSSVMKQSGPFRS